MRVPPDQPLPPSSHGVPVDVFPEAAALERALAASIRGEVRFDRASRAMYASDASNYRQVPIGLVLPADEDDVRAAVAACRAHGAPVLPRGAGTSLAGQACNVAVVIDFTRHLHRIVDVDPGARTARVQPGVVLDTLRDRAEHHGLTFGPDPSTHSRCTLGGMIGNNSCGTHSLMSGKTVDNIESLRVLLYDGTELTVGATSEDELRAIVVAGGRRGEIYAGLVRLRDRHADLIRERLPDIPRRVSGYNLDQLLPEHGFHVARALVGSEGTCVTILEATARLVPSPPCRALVGLGYPDVFAAADHVPALLTCHPIGLEGFEGVMVDGLRRKGAPHLDLIPPGRGILLVEFGGDTDLDAGAQADRLQDLVARGPAPPEVRRYTSAEARAVWKIRESGPRAAGGGPGQPPRYEGWDDAAVAPEKLGRYLRELRTLLDEYGYQAAYYGHFGHGCIHMQVSFDLRSDAGVRQYGEFIDRAADLVVRHGGSISGEHGDGQARGALLPKMFGPELMGALREFKTLWDPDNRMNPGKLIDAYPPTASLRLGADYAPREPATHFAYANDGGSFANAALRCIGVGECRKLDAGTMCPSYMVTREERHSTRGRARMLFEMLQGEAVTGGWRDEGVKQSLDLCLACKACKSECPTNVDLATYKAEFLSHYYEGRRRPIRAYALGRVDRWLRLASRTPRLANGLMHSPLSSPVRRLLGLARARSLPALAPVPFSRTNAGTTRTTRNGGAEAVLWVDTFNNHFHPGTLMAARAVLEETGARVLVPQSPLCCGRPLYDFGMLDEARQYLRDVMNALAPQIDAGLPVVVLEPGCASVFRDELGQLFPKDARAARLAQQTRLLPEYLDRHAPGFVLPRLSQRVLLHGHCHQKAVMKTGDEAALLRRMGAEVSAPDAGCCGMAGPFGMSEETEVVGRAIGERVLLPAVRAAGADTLVVASGFSCREQIRQTTGREALHLADVLARALVSLVPLLPFASFVSPA